MKLDLGSTAKMRTLIHYLELMAELHKKLKGKGPKELDKLLKQADDPLTRLSLEKLKVDSSV
jgi:hypothetical protein